jgi:dTDP-4-dehydrorhamnose reductase
LKIVVTGREGQVVRSLIERGEIAGHDIVPLGRPEFDLTGDADAIVAALESSRPEVIVSAAAYTEVDKAEAERDLAFAVNNAGAEAVASAANRLGVPLIHLSTDYVFDGAKIGAYDETDETGPTGVYGESKLAGERAVLATHDDVAVLRTAWVYSPFGVNFLKTMLRLAGQRDELGVVGDQRGNPTSALDIADGVIAIASNLCSGGDPARRGIFHMSGAGDASWAEFAKAIFAASAALGGPFTQVTEIGTNEYPTVARRPANSRLTGDKLEAVHGVRLPEWRSSMINIVERLVWSDDTQRTKA